MFKNTKFQPNDEYKTVAIVFELAKIWQGKTRFVFSCHSVNAIVHQHVIQERLVPTSKIDDCLTDDLSHAVHCINICPRFMSCYLVSESFYYHKRAPLPMIMRSRKNLCISRRVLETYWHDETKCSDSRYVVDMVYNNIQIYYVKVGSSRYGLPVGNGFSHNGSSWKSTCSTRNVSGNSKCNSCSSSRSIPSSS